LKFTKLQELEDNHGQGDPRCLNHCDVNLIADRKVFEKHEHIDAYSGQITEHNVSNGKIPDQRAILLGIGEPRLENVETVKV
jgi:hypothetical protein